MDRWQLSFNMMTNIFLLVGGITAFIIWYHKRLPIWLYTAVIFILAGLNKIFDFDNYIGNILLYKYDGFISFMHEAAPWLKLYKQPGFVVDFGFLVFGAMIVFFLYRHFHPHPSSNTLFIEGVCSFILVIVLGFILAVGRHSPQRVVFLQLLKDFFEVTGSAGFFLSFLTYYRGERR